MANQRNPWYYGNELMLFIDGSALAFATSHTFSMNAETEQISTKDHGRGPATLSNNTTWEITTENLYTEDFGVLQQACKSGTELDVIFGSPTNYDTYGENGIYGKTEGEGQSETDAAWTAPSSGVVKGKAIVTSLSVNANAGENATYSATLTGSGAFESIYDESDGD